MDNQKNIIDDLTIEYVVTQDKYKELFPNEIIQICNERLGRK